MATISAKVDSLTNRSYSSSSLLAISYLLLAISYLLVSACTHAIPRFGTGGQYAEGRDQLQKTRGGDIDKAIASLESVVRENPTYQDSLSLLGRAYYKKGRYRDAYLILQRALVVNKDDEIAWLVMGLTQLRLGDDQKGLEAVKGGITLLSRVSTSGYRSFPNWDDNGAVRSAIRRAVFLASKGQEEKEELIRAAESLLTRIDDEDYYQRVQTPQQKRRDFGG